ncbi:hypothetical protein PISMIDRAFT_19520 [Pisolithus microcarpus 441]|uniref:Uncharacterized protein n=1 Tax=Pisolithus microcarpus 441 TaxID=765257 RepID=A0A0C9YC22_9AGAM|nr:hypothetical protein BKA83DRAFT_19520 [Pisolithus microcarpus]KIK11449.1 hypothetical protein PISMIDRAFT_19520 [Pisolithus microcarpus 441]
MSNKTIGRIIPIHIRTLWRRDKPARMLHNHPDIVFPSPDQQLSTDVASSGTSQVLSF